MSWATGEGIVTAAPVANYSSEEAGPTSMVMYGTTSGNYTTNTSSTIFTSYSQVYNFSNANPILNYSSPLFHHVTIQNLAPNTQYYYKVGDPKLGMSQEFNFTSPPAVGTSSYPFVLGVVADTGLTPNTTVTIQHLVDAKPQVWTLIGDFSYADDMQTNGTSLLQSPPCLADSCMQQRCVVLYHTGIFVCCVSFAVTSVCFSSSSHCQSPKVALYHSCALPQLS